MKKFVILLVVVAMLAIAGCGPSGEPGTVNGRVMAPNGTDPIVGATVTVKGTSLTATSNAAGNYQLSNVPAGSQTVVAVKGSYRSEKKVTVSGGGTVTAPDAKLAPVGKIGVVPGIYDDIGTLLTSLGLTYEELSGLHTSTVFTTPSQLDDYSVIFFACGGDSWPDDSTNAAIITNLRNFVSNGGNLYLSDWAILLVETLFPGKVTLRGMYGNEGTVTGTVLNSELQEVLGKTQCTIEYDLGSWMVIDSVAAGVTVDVQGTVSAYDPDTFEDLNLTNKPLLVEFTYGSGRVILTTFHNEVQVTQDALKILKHLIFRL